MQLTIRIIVYIYNN